MCDGSTRILGAGPIRQCSGKSKVKLTSGRPEETILVEVQSGSRWWRGEDGRQGSSHLRGEEAKENATYSISCHNEPGGYFTYLALMLLCWPGSIFLIRHAQMERVAFPQFSIHDRVKKKICSCYSFSSFFFLTCFQFSPKTLPILSFSFHVYT